MTDELPAAGGSYIREADGALRPAEAPQAPVPDPVKPPVNPAAEEA